MTFLSIHQMNAFEIQTRDMGSPNKKAGFTVGFLAV